MNWYPIIFDDESVRRIQAGLQTMARRVVIPQLPGGAEDVYLWSEPEIPGSPLECWYFHNYKCCCWGPVPYGIAGDRLWVKGTRIVLERVGDRPPERLQDISRADAKLEGFWPGVNGLEQACGRSWGNAQLAFRAFWDSLNAKRGHGWDKNEWVWPVGFRRVEDA